MSEVEWARLKAHELRALANQNAVVIIPTAATEQHGPHLPVMTDSLLGHEIAVRAARKAFPTRPTLVTPVIWPGLSEHHMPYGGTLILDHDTFVAVLRCLITSVKRHGFQDVLISNSHGGNALAVQVAADRLATETGATIVATTYPSEAGEAFNQHLEDQPHLMHACEGETSMMMALVPDLVDTSDLAGIAVPRGKGALKAGNASYRWRSFTAVTANGISGDPTRSNPDKGEKLLEAAGQCLADLITDPETWAPAPDMRGREIDGVPFRDK